MEKQHVRFYCELFLRCNLRTLSAPQAAIPNNEIEDGERKKRSENLTGMNEHQNFLVVNIRCYGRQSCLAGVKVL